ncbi:MAG: hypothetical protein LBJ64_10825 [Deltaproteobacteria bacterium]|jgi:hypothetical protein|nr:hypothetical protein [Deltaproteobacteria bacterium]
MFIGFFVCLRLAAGLLPIASETDFCRLQEEEVFFSANGAVHLRQTDGEILLAARPNPYNRGNCFQWKRCLGESIGNMWVDSPDFCGPLGGKSWKGRDGKCLDLMDVPWEDDPAKRQPRSSR